METDPRRPTEHPPAGSGPRRGSAAHSSGQERDRHPADGRPRLTSARPETKARLKELLWTPAQQTRVPAENPRPLPDRHALAAQERQQHVLCSLTRKRGSRFLASGTDRDLQMHVPVPQVQAFGHGQRMVGTDFNRGAVGFFGGTSVRSAIHVSRPALSRTSSATVQLRSFGYGSLRGRSMDQGHECKEREEHSRQPQKEHPLRSTRRRY